MKRSDRRESFRAKDLKYYEMFRFHFVPLNMTPMIKILIPQITHYQYDCDGRGIFAYFFAGRKKYGLSEAS